MARSPAFLMLMLISAAAVTLWAHGLAAPEGPAFALSDPAADAVALGELDSRVERAAEALTAALGPPPGAAGYNAASATAWANFVAADMGAGPVAYMPPPSMADGTPEA